MNAPINERSQRGSAFRAPVIRSLLGALIAALVAGFSSDLLASTVPPISEVHANDILDVSVKFECDAVADEYEWRWRPRGNTAWSRSGTNPKSGHAVSDLRADITYEFACQVTCRGLRSGWSTTEMFTTLETCLPPTLGQIVVTEITNTSALVTCTAPAELYLLRWRMEGAPTWTGLSPFEDGIVTLMPLEQGTGYEVEFQLVCRTVTSDWSPTKTFQTLHPCPAPTLAQIGSLEETHESVRLGCNHPTADGFQWFWRKSGNTAWSASGFSADNTLVLTGLAENTLYEFACQVTCGALTSDWSSSGSFETLERCPAATDAEVLAEDATAHSLQFRCLVPAEMIRWRWREQGDPTWIYGPLETRLFRRVAGLQSNTTYEFSCQLSCGELLSNWSPTETAQTSQECLPPTPDDFVFITLTEIVAIIQCTLDADEYAWRIRELGATNWFETDSGAFNAYGFGTLSPGTTYEWACQLTCGAIVSDWSATQTLTTLSNVKAPTFSSIQFLPGTRTLVMTWNSEPGETFLIEISSDARSWAILQPGYAAAAGASSTSYAHIAPEGVLRSLFRVSRE